MDLLPELIIIWSWNQSYNTITEYYIISLSLNQKEAAWYKERDSNSFHKILQLRYFAWIIIFVVTSGCVVTDGKIALKSDKKQNESMINSTLRLIVHGWQKVLWPSLTDTEGFQWKWRLTGMVTFIAVY